MTLKEVREVPMPEIKELTSDQITVLSLSVQFLRILEKHCGTETELDEAIETVEWDLDHTPF